MSNDNTTNLDHRRSIVACLVQGVYILKRDRQENHDADSCIFGAIYKSKHPPSQHTPSYVIAFRDTLNNGNAFSRDLELDIHLIKNGLHRTSRFDITMQAVRNLVRSQASKSNIWLTGHPLGSAMALLTGKRMAKTGIFLDLYLLYYNLRFLCLKYTKNLSRLFLGARMYIE
ncbi:putative fungal lipase-like domain, alpha/Beta hydrolase [Helianthus anomalus]